MDAAPPAAAAIAAIKPDYVPGALTSAGLFICFASIYAAYALLDLIGPTTAFIGLAMVALVAFALAALHSPIVAVIGLLAGFATPALISSPGAECHGSLRLSGAHRRGRLCGRLYRAWGWLAFGATAGGLLWVRCGSSTFVMQRDDLADLRVFLAG